MRKTLLTILLLSVTTSATVSQPQLSRALVEGVVVKQGSGEPLAGVVVELSRTGNVPAGAPAVLTATTGIDGKFAFPGVMAGTYRLVATRYGGTYHPAQYGQRDARSPGTPLTLLDGQEMKNVRLEMSATGSISGRVYDRNGDPVPYARVLAMQAWYHEGNRLLDFVQAVHTNDRGEYRLYWLPPGRYYVAARPEDLASSGTTTFVNPPDRIAMYHEEVSTSPPLTRRILDNGQVITETYELVYYGAQTDALKAQSLDLRPGGALLGIDIPLEVGTVRARKIHGVLINGATGQPAAGARVSALPAIFGSSRVAPAAVADANGVFTLSGLTSEAYILHFRTTGNLFGFFPVEAGTGDVAGVSLVAKPGVNVNGRISFDGRPQTDNDPDLPRLQVLIVQDPGIPGVPNAPPATPAPNGTFTVQNVGPAGWDFEIFVGGTRPPGTYVKSIKLGTQDVLNGKFYPERGASQRGGLHIDRTPDLPLEIVLGTGAGSVEIQVVTERRDPAPYRTVALLPDVPLRHRFDLYRTGTTDTNGKVQFQNVTPGSYKIFSWDQIERGAWEDTTQMLAYEGRGQAIRVQENSRATLEVKVIP